MTVGSDRDNARKPYFKSLVTQHDSLRKSLAPRLNKYIKHKPYPKQIAFLCMNAFLEGFYGGAASGGKSDALLMAALQYVDVPGYAALLLRRTFRELSLPSALLDRARQWLANTDAKWSPTKMTWIFPSGATITFGYLQHEGDVYQYDSAEFQFIGFDELTQFSETQYRFMASRLRKPKTLPVPLRIRGASNPGGVGHLWVKERLIKGADLAKGRFFIPARKEDNPSVDQDSYDKSLEMLDEVTRQQRKYGNWDVADIGNMFKREWLSKIVPVAPVEAMRCRFWDFAASEGKGDYTVGLKMAIDDSGLIFIEDVVRGQWSPNQCKKIVKQVADVDTPDVIVRLEQEPGSSGKVVVADYVTLLMGYDIAGIFSSGSKLTRLRPLAAQAEAGNVKLVSAPWNSDFIDEMIAIPNVKHDDQGDAAGGAFNALSATPIVDFGFGFIGRR